MNESLKGIYAALSCYLIWGLVPIYWKLATHISAFELIAHRVLWSSILCLIFVSFLKKKNLLFQTLKKSFGSIILSTLLISINWLIFVWAVNDSRIIETSLGYYINPLMSILLGALVLKEKLSSLQKLATTIAGFAVLYLILSSGIFPWVSISLASTFAIYGLIRKVAPVDPLVGLSLEATLVAPIAILFIGSEGQHFGTSFSNSLLLIGGGVVTLAPLLLFLYSLKRVELSTMGFLQFFAPTTSFIIAILFYNEPFNIHRGITFLMIGIAVILYLSDINLKAKSKKKNA